MGDPGKGRRADGSIGSNRVLHGRRSGRAPTHRRRDVLRNQFERLQCLVERRNAGVELAENVGCDRQCQLGLELGDDLVRVAIETVEPRQVAVEVETGRELAFGDLPFGEVPNARLQMRFGRSLVDGRIDETGQADPGVRPLLRRCLPHSSR